MVGLAGGDRRHALLEPRPDTLHFAFRRQQVALTRAPAASSRTLIVPFRVRSPSARAIFCGAHARRALRVAQRELGRDVLAPDGGGADLGCAPIVAEAKLDDSRPFAKELGAAQVQFAAFVGDALVQIVTTRSCSSRSVSRSASLAVSCWTSASWSARSWPAASSRLVSFHVMPKRLGAAAHGRAPPSSSARRAPISARRCRRLLMLLRLRGAVIDGSAASPCLSRELRA